MHELRTEIDIDAAPEVVWSILLDFRSHPEWNPFIRRIEGIAEAGQRLSISVQPQGGKGMTFRPTVLAAIPNQELRWRGRLLLPGIFDGEHYLLIERRGPNAVKFIHGEKFSGLLIPLAKSSLEGGTRAGFVAMNEALKARAEARARA